ncbi:hypothetical protein [Moorena sp. SIO3H5]|nr:hypothetical protein [Moorena sp. SIO3H5]NEO70143.1 hypothetical protein [Moorena sp. SIO3H5]
MQRGLGGFPHERLHQDGNSGQEFTKSDAARSWGFPPLAIASRTVSENYF